jgi:signal transduction histidine kinase
VAINVETIQGNNRKIGVRKSGPGHAWLGAASGAGRWASFIYHDLRHPLTAILAYSELLAEYDLDRPQREDFHQEIRRAVSRMNDLISLLLEFSKDPETFRSEIADIVVTVKRAIQVVAVRPEFRRIAIHYEHEGLTEGRFDPGGLQQVITNIVLNACEAVSPTSGRVEVRSLGRPDCVEISVSDNGPGIPEPVRHAVFQPFVSYGKEGGTGLGLAIVQKILRAHGGDICLDTTGEKGTHFRFVLPFGGPRKRAWA